MLASNFSRILLCLVLTVVISNESIGNAQSTSLSSSGMDSSILPTMVGNSQATASRPLPLLPKNLNTDPQNSISAGLQPRSIRAEDLDLPSNYELISLDNAGNLRQGVEPAISSDGYFVVFQSSDSNLVDGDTNGKTDIFLRNRKTNITLRVSVDSSGNQANDNSFNPSISGDGHYVVFRSEATNLVNGDTNNKTDVFLLDTLTHTITRVSADNAGIQGNDDSYEPKISDNGLFIVFSSSASNLIPGDTNNAADIFLYNIQTKMISRVSMGFDGTQANNISARPSISANGRFIVFSSSATNLVEGDTNGFTDIFLFDTQSGKTSIVSLNDAGIQANNETDEAEISGNGRFVGFKSYASNLTENDTNEGEDVFVYDITEHTVKIWGWASKYYYTGEFSLSYNGRFFAYESIGPSFTTFYRDILTGSWDNVAFEGQITGGGVSLSGDGRLLAYAQEISSMGGSYIFVKSFQVDPCPQATQLKCNYVPILKK